jgi:hypothetical protein
MITTGVTMKYKPLSFLVALLIVTVSTGGAAPHSPLLATILQASDPARARIAPMLDRAALLVKTGQPALGAVMYMAIAEAAEKTHHLDIAAEAYQKAAEAFHLAKDPGQEAIAYGRQADVYQKQANVLLPAPPVKNAPAKPAPSRPAQPATRAAQAPPARSAPALNGNPLIGRWLPMPETNQTRNTNVEVSCTYSELIFTPTTETQSSPGIGPFPATTHVDDVTYNLTDPRILYVILKAPLSEPGRITLIDRDHIQPDTISGCIYRRE